MLVYITYAKSKKNLETTGNIYIELNQY